MDGNESKSTVTAKQEKAIVAVLEGRSIREGLKRANVSPTIFYQWMREDDTFRGELERRRKELTEEGHHLLKVSVYEAANTMLELLKTAQGEAVRLRAAESILERVSKIAEAEDIEARLTALEKEIGKGVGR